MKFKFWRKDKELLPKPAIEFSDITTIQDVITIGQIIRLIKYYGANNKDEKNEFVVLVHFYHYQFSEYEWLWSLDYSYYPSNEDVMVEVVLHDRSVPGTIAIYRLHIDNPIVEQIKNAMFSKHNKTLKERVDNIVGKENVCDN